MKSAGAVFIKQYSETIYTCSVVKSGVMVYLHLLNKICTEKAFRHEFSYLTTIFRLRAGLYVI